MNTIIKSKFKKYLENNSMVYNKVVLFKRYTGFLQKNFPVSSVNQATKTDSLYLRKSIIL